MRFAGKEPAFATYTFYQQHFSNAMHNEIGVTAYGRGEMRVAGCCQSEMPLVLLAVSRLPERAQHQVRQDALFGFARDFRSQLLIHTCVMAMSSGTSCWRGLRPPP